MIITLLVVVIIICIVGSVWAERAWFSPRFWMLQPYAGLKFIGGYLIVLVGLLCVPLIGTAVLLGWP